MVGQHERGAADGLSLAGQGGQLGEAGVPVDGREEAEGAHASILLDDRAFCLDRRAARPASRPTRWLWQRYGYRQGIGVWLPQPYAAASALRRAARGCSDV